MADKSTQIMVSHFRDNMSLKISLLISVPHPPVVWKQARKSPGGTLQEFLNSFSCSERTIFHSRRNTKHTACFPAFLLFFWRKNDSQISPALTWCCLFFPLCVVTHTGARHEAARPSVAQRHVFILRSKACKWKHVEKVCRKKTTSCLQTTLLFNPEICSLSLFTESCTVTLLHANERLLLWEL